MNIEQYKESGRAIYEELANTIASILHQAIVGVSDQPYRFLHIERRAKSLDSLREKLRKNSRLETEQLAVDIKDLAGCRVVFYSNGDVERFLRSGILRDNFEIDPRRTKPHYPVPGLTDSSNQFRSDNIVVRLKAPRTELLEYAKLAGLWCEVQVQTILNHSWSETAHNITYKRPSLNGIGTQLMSRMDARLQGIMKQYLAPAGYAFQQVLDDYDRVMRAKALNDEKAVARILTVDNNNARKDLLDQVGNDLLPVVDDLPALTPRLLQTLVESVTIARNTVQTPRVVDDMTFAGATFDEYLASVVDTLRDLLEADVDGVTDAALTLYRQAATESFQSALFSLARPLAEKSLLAWHKAGEAGEPYLLTALKALSDAAILPMATELIDELVAGGMVPYSGQLGVAREKCVDFLQSLYKPTLTNSEKLQVHHALFTATRGVRRPSGSILRDTLLLSARIVRFCIALSREERFEILRNLENKILWLHRSFTIVPANHVDPIILAAHSELSRAIIDFRQATTDERFVIFKTIVGHDSVFPPAWDNDQFEIDGHEAYRLAQLEGYIDLASKDPDKWFEILRECSASVVEDRTTIGHLRNFPGKIASTHPSIACDYINRDDPSLAHFYEPLLTGLAKSRPEFVTERLDAWLSNGMHLDAISEYLRISGAVESPFAGAVLEASIAQRNFHVIYQCLGMVFEQPIEDEKVVETSVLQPAMRFLTTLNDTTWLVRSGARYKLAVIERLSEASIDVVLTNLLACRRIDHTAEPLLARIGRRSPKKIIEFFARRIRNPLAENVERYDPVPFEFHQLGPILANEAQYAVDQALVLHEGGDFRIRDQSTRLVTNIFPDFSGALEDVLRRTIRSAGGRHLPFVLDVLGHYEGNLAIHPICQEIVEVLPLEDDLLGQLQIVLWNAGLLAGEFGHVQSLREKRASMENWLSDSREKVRLFAREVIEDYEKEMTSEQQRAENDVEMRRLRYEEPADVEPSTTVQPGDEGDPGRLG